MNECLKLQQQLDDYLSDRISDFAKRRIEAHLRRCSECASEVEDYRETIEQLRSASRKIAIEPSYKLQYGLDRIATGKASAESADRQQHLSFGRLLKTSLKETLTVK